MILAVDAGNTAVTLGCVEGREILNLARLAASPGRSADEYAVLMERVLSLRGVKLREFEGAAIASVVPPLTEVLREAVRAHNGPRRARRRRRGQDRPQHRHRRPLADGRGPRSGRCGGAGRP